MYKICIDPGHGGTDPGAVNGAVYEKHRADHRIYQCAADGCGAYGDPGLHGDPSRWPAATQGADHFRFPRRRKSGTF